MAAPQTIVELIERFDRNRAAYKSDQYNEARLRIEFLNPFFEALGWDINNKQGYAEAYKDVIYEDAIKIGGATKAPDYCFRIGGTRKFFVEAKKPAINLKEASDPAFQLRRYAWSAKLPLSILTDFEEFAIYDCRVKPDREDRAAIARIVYLPYTDYVQRWDEIAAIFSREAILKGSFDTYAEATKGKRGTTEVDAAFLQEIESWREMLARHLALRNKTLSQRELNFAVQMTIDRIIFLRICEDRGIEEYERLKALLKGPNVYKRLCAIFQEADDRYNSGLFHFQKEKDNPEAPDTLTLSLVIDDKPLKDIFKRLYYPESPYEFSVLPIVVLGQVYEQFLGRVIRLTSSHHVEIEEKPEVRKAGGVYYTPTFIVDYIIQNTLSKLLEGKKPGVRGSASKIKIVDPSCGSGSFLIGAYQYLLDWHRDRYVEEGPDKHRKELYQGAGGQWLLTTQEKKRILLNSIYGVDIDPQAVEVTKLSLLLKVLEGESNQSLVAQLSLFKERALPDLDRNIKCGNSLIGTDFYDIVQMSLLDEEEQYRINVFDWASAFPDVFSGNEPGFDVVIGNPPYDVMEKERGASSWPHMVLGDYGKKRLDYAPALGGKLNLFRFFLVRSLALTRQGGYFGMIMPLALLGDISCSYTRRHLMLSGREVIADCFPQKDNPNYRIFHGAKLSTVVITCERTGSIAEESASILVHVYPRNSFNDPYRECYIRLVDTKLLDPKHTPIPLVDAHTWAVCLRIYTAPKIMRLGEIKEFAVTRGEINQTVYRSFIKDSPDLARLLKGVEVGRYHLQERLSQGHREWFDEQEFLRIHTVKPIVNHQRIATQRITGVDERLRIVATLINPPAYFADSTNSITLGTPSPYRLEYLLGLLNSFLFQWRFKFTSTNNNVGTNELEAMPFRTINFSDPADKAYHDRLVEHVKQMLSLYKRLSEARTPRDKTVMQQQIDVTNRQIDRLVYELYGLTEEEVKIVEGKAQD